MPIRVLRLLAAILPLAWWTALLLFALVMAALATLVILTNRAATLRTAEARVQSLAQLFIEHADLAINDGEKLIVAVRPLVASWDRSDPVVGRQIFEEMHRFIAGSPQIAAAWITDRTGTSVLDTWTYPSRRIDGSSRLYFKAHMEGAPDPVIAGQEKGRVTGKPRFTLSRAIRAPEGQIEAIIVVGIYSEYFEALYQSTIAGPSAMARLLVVRGRGQSEVLARLVKPDFSAELRDTWLSLIEDRPYGVATVRLASRPRVVGWQSSRTHSGMVAATSQSVSAALERWKWGSAAIGVATALSVTGFVLLAFYGAKSERARRQLEQQQLLTREVHHRVKNNLAIVAAMIRAGARQLDVDARAQDLFSRVGAQVSSMAALYDLMQHTPGTERLELNDLLARLCRELAGATSRAVDYVPGELDAIETDQAIPVMIIVNELVTNSIKHSAGPVTVCCAAGPQEHSVTVENRDGEFEPTFDPAAQESFGLRMARTLASSLKGSIELVSRKPATIRLTFPN